MLFGVLRLCHICIYRDINYAPGSRLIDLSPSLLPVGNHFSTSGAPSVAIWAPRGHPGRPWGQQDGRKMVVYRIFSDFGVILGPVYIRFLISRSLEFRFVFRACFQVFFYRSRNRHIDVRDFQIVAFAMKVLQKRLFTKSCFMIFVVFGRPWELLFWFFGPWKHV